MCLSSDKFLMEYKVIRLHFSFSHLEHFIENFGDLNEKQKYRFHQDIRAKEEQ